MVGKTTISTNKKIGTKMGSQVGEMLDCNYYRRECYGKNNVLIEWPLSEGGASRVLGRGRRPPISPPCPIIRTRPHSPKLHLGQNSWHPQPKSSRSREDPFRKGHRQTRRLVGLYFFATTRQITSQWLQPPYVTTVLERPTALLLAKRIFNCFDLHICAPRTIPRPLKRGLRQHSENDVARWIVGARKMRQAWAAR